MKRIYFRSIFLSIFFLLGMRDNPVFAHGAHYTIDRAEAMIIRVEYDNGEPMSYAEVKVFSPDNHKIEYQNGRTDQKGQFSFLPEKGGEWMVVVSDGMGHGAVAKISTDNKADPGLPVQSFGYNKWQKVIMALSVVWGFIGLAFFLQARMVQKP